MFNFKKNKKQMPINLFIEASNKVVAYKKFLDKHSVKQKDIKSINDFKLKVPLMYKENYLCVYPFKELVKNGVIPAMVSASSGSSGKPFYWPRGDEQEIQGGKLHEKIFRDIFALENKKTLVIVCFSMGNWIAGTFTAASCRYVAKQKDMNISVITPGIEKEDIISILKDFTIEFESVVLAGYPPFLMDIVMESKKRNLSFDRFDCKFLFAGENFSENWRELICDSACISNSLTETVNVYGTADAGALGHENPLSIFLRKKATEDSLFNEEFFGQNGFIPSLIQFDPNIIYFELIDGQLVFTANTGIPLIRYNIQDRGLIIEIKKIIEISKKFGFYDQISDYINKWNYPLVALFGRSDVAVTFYALNIYPENIKLASEKKVFLNKLTGKFLARVDFDETQTIQTLIISFELSEGVNTTEEIKTEMQKILVESLISSNAEYRKLYNAIGGRALPIIELIDFGNEIFKLKKNKQTWIKKT